MTCPAEYNRFERRIKLAEGPSRRKHGTSKNPDETTLRHAAIPAPQRIRPLAHDSAKDTRNDMSPQAIGYGRSSPLYPQKRLGPPHRDVRMARAATSHTREKYLLLHTRKSDRARPS
jgi:hypothetical protein